MLLVTSVGDIDIELWAKETPKACRNFCQLCMEGYYDGTIFHRVVKGFIAQGGDPTGTGTGGESIHGKPFKVGNETIFMLARFFSLMHIFKFNNLVSNRMKFINGYDLFDEDSLPWQMLVKMTTEVSFSSPLRLRPNYKESTRYSVKLPETLFTIC